eukprot:985202-Rhodomonas_salina.1
MTVQVCTRPPLWLAALLLFTEAVPVRLFMDAELLFTCRIAARGCDAVLYGGNASVCAGDDGGDAGYNGGDAGYNGGDAGYNGGADATSAGAQRTGRFRRLATPRRTSTTQTGSPDRRSH